MSRIGQCMTVRHMAMYISFIAVRTYVYGWVMDVEGRCFGAETAASRCAVCDESVSLRRAHLGLCTYLLKKLSRLSVRGLWLMVNKRGCLCVYAHPRGCLWPHKQ